jgi:hypothetical protein
MSKYIVSITSENLFRQVKAKLHFWILNKSGTQTRKQLEDPFGYVSFERFIKTRSFRKFDSSQVKNALLIALKEDSYSFELNETEEKFRLSRSHPLAMIEDF